MMTREELQRLMDSIQKQPVRIKVFLAYANPEGTGRPLVADFRTDISYIAGHPIKPSIESYLREQVFGHDINLHYDNEEKTYYGKLQALFIERDTNPDWEIEVTIE